MVSETAAELDVCLLITTYFERLKDRKIGEGAYAVVYQGMYAKSQIDWAITGGSRFM